MGIALSAGLGGVIKNHALNSNGGLAHVLIGVTLLATTVAAVNIVIMLIQKPKKEVSTEGAAEELAP